MAEHDDFDRTEGQARAHRLFAVLVVAAAATFSISRLALHGALLSCSWEAFARLDQQIRNKFRKLDNTEKDSQTNNKK